MTEQVSVVIGAGSLGTELAARLSHDSTVLLADFRREPLHAAAGRIALDGGDVVTKDVDVRNRQSVRALATMALGLGPVTRLVYSAGVSPAEALPSAIFTVDMLGAGIVIEEFEGVIAPDGAAVVVSGMHGHLVGSTLVDPALESAILASRVEDLILLPDVQAVLAAAREDVDTARAFAFALAKRVNQLHVRAAAARWALRGARINSVSPGNLEAVVGPADAVEFLLGDGSTAINGTDLLVDGGAVATTTYPA